MALVWRLATITEGNPETVDTGNVLFFFADRQGDLKPFEDPRERPAKRAFYADLFFNPLYSQGFSYYLLDKPS